MSYNIRYGTANDGENALGINHKTEMPELLLTTTISLHIHAGVHN